MDDRHAEGLDARSLIDQYARWRRRGALLVWGALLVAVLLTLLIAALEQSGAPVPDVRRVGVHLLLDDGRSAWDMALWWHHLGYAAQIVGDGGIAVQLVRQDDLEHNKWQYFIDSCAELDMQPVLRLATTQDPQQGFWQAPQADADGRYHALAAQYARFVASLDWRGMTPYLIILNEPNNGTEWSGRPDAAAYARLLVDVASALRAAVPDVRILNAALDLYAPNTGSQPFPNGLHYVDASSFMDAMAAAEPGVFASIDLWNSHSYPMGAFIAPPWEHAYQFDAIHDAVLTDVQPPAHIRNRGINGYEWELWKLAQLGVTPPPVMITETGWRHARTDQEDYPDAATAAAYLDMALRGNPGRYPQYPRSGWTPWLLDERVVGVALFALNGAPMPWESTNLLRMTADGNVAGTTPLFDLLRTIQG